jgi:predicted phosphodiesterase
MPESTTSVAVIADVHGNEQALVAVLADLGKEHWDRLVVAGDHVFNGPRPAESWQRLRALDAPKLLGNTDAYLFQQDRRRGVNDLAAWTAALLGPEAVAEIARLPVSERITPPGGVSPRDDLLVVHATPTDIDAELVVAPNPTGSHKLTPEDEAVAMLGDVQADLIVHGHLHYASSGSVRGQRVASIGSVGASLDGDPRAAWALVRWDGEHWYVENRRTPYDYLAAADELERMHLFPSVGRVLAERIRQARWIPFAPYDPEEAAQARKKLAQLGVR